MGVDKAMDDNSDWPPIRLDQANIENVSAYSAIKQEVVVIEDVYHDTTFNFQGTKRYDELTGYRTRSMLVLPLITYRGDEAKLLGIIQLMNSIDVATGEIASYESTSSIPLLIALSRIAANTLANKIHIQEIAALYDISINDDLTGLGNRRYYNNVLSQRWNISLQRQEPLSFLILDIDHFKKVNDTYGHVSGDLVLKGIAAVLKNSLRGSDHIARWGGEEFAIILTKTSMPSALKVAENVRSAVENAIFEIENERKIKLTVSIGVHSITVQPESEYTLVKFLSDADAALYRAKQTGRNKVCHVEM